ncbi:MAG: NAD-dependent epimerase/dehydratase family protein, partial [Gaiellaceae bacterium]
VTGASGLVGRLVLEGLGERYAFSGLSRRPVDGIPHLSASVDDLDAIRPAFEGVDMVLHLAAYTDDLDDWDKHFAITAGGTANVFRAAQEAGVWRVVLMSTGSTMLGYEWDEGSPYGMLARGEWDRASDWPMLDQHTPPRPDSPYGISKLFAEACGRYFADKFGMSVPVIRLGAVLDTDRPKLIRHFPGYLSQADAVSIVDCCLSAPASLRFEIFDAMSENRGRWRDTTPAKDLLGWRPVGTSDAFDPSELGG